MKINYSFLKIAFIFIICFSCNNKNEKKYFIIIERTSKSVLTNKEEREDLIDSIWAYNDENAYDSCIGMIYGMKVTDSILKEALQNANKKENYPYYGRKIIGYKIINDSGANILTNIPDSLKEKVKKKWVLPT